MIFKRLPHTLMGTLILGTLGIWGCTNARPPDNLLAKTEAQIEKAKDLGAQQHAPVELLDAESKLSRAKRAINKEQYANAETILEQAMVDAEHAAIKSRSIKAKTAASTVHEDIEVLREELGQESAEYSSEPGEYSSEN